MVRRRTATLLVALALTGAGCNRQDADCLAKIGGLLMKRAQTLKEKSTTNSKSGRALPELGLFDPGAPPGNVNGDPNREK